MNKKKTLKKQGLTLEDFSSTPMLDEKKVAELEELNPQKCFTDHEKVATALLDCLIDNDTETFMEILDSYLRVNRARASQSAGLTRATVQLAFSKNGNPTLKTIAKIVHHETRNNKERTLRNK